MERDLAKDEPAKVMRIEAELLSEESDRSRKMAKAIENVRPGVQSAFVPVRVQALASDRKTATRVAVDLFEDDHALTRLAENILADRGLRKTHFPGELFSEPAWDMLLCLFVADARETWLSEASVCSASGAPRSAVIRWINFMKNAGIIEHIDASQSGQPAYIKITTSGAAQMRNYLKSILDIT